MLYQHNLFSRTSQTLNLVKLNFTKSSDPADTLRMIPEVG